jgi:hypothetical protein
MEAAVSRGPGRVQRQLGALFEDQPGKQFTVEDLVHIVYPGQPVTPIRRACIREAMEKIGPALKISIHRVGLVMLSRKSKSRAWTYQYQRGMVKPTPDEMHFP